MTDKSNFTPDEWKLLLEGVAMAGIASLSAQTCGVIDTRSRCQVAYKSRIAKEGGCASRCTKVHLDV